MSAKTEPKSMEEGMKLMLYVYDWSIENFSMMKDSVEPFTSPEFIVGPSENMKWTISLCSNSDERIRIDMKIATSIENSLEIKDKNFSLSFLDSKNKVLDNFSGILFGSVLNEEKKIFVSKREIESFLFDDTLKIRSKLSLRCQILSPVERPIKNVSETFVPNKLKRLSNSLKTFFLEKRLFPDVVIRVGDREFLAHKAILYSRCPFFTDVLREVEAKEAQKDALQFKEATFTTSAATELEKASSVVKSDEGNVVLKKPLQVIELANGQPDVFNLILYHIYCGDVLLDDSNCDFEMYDGAKKCGLRALAQFLSPTEMNARTRIKIEKTSFTWHISDFSTHKKCGHFSPIYSPHFKTGLGCEITWKLCLFFFDDQDFLLSLQRVTGHDTEIQSVFKLSVLKEDETPSYVREFKHLFNAKSVSNVYPGFLDAGSRFTVHSDLLKDDALTVLCELTVTDGAASTEILKSCHDTDREIDLKALPRNFLSLLKSEKYSDVFLKCEDVVLNVHKCILAARSPVFERMFENEMAEAKTGTVVVKDVIGSVMKLLITYIYSSDLHDLSMEHAPELYTAADKYELIDLRVKCSQFMHAHMDVDSACDVLILAELHQDKQLKASAKDFISRRAGQTLLTPQGRHMMEHHPNLAYDILENLSAVYCTLPPQEFNDKKSKERKSKDKSKDITEMNG